jgi:hypothetical protein
MPAIKPPPGTPIDWSSPLAWGLSGAWLFSEGAGNPANSVPGRSPATLVSAPTRVATPYGSGVATAGGSYVDCGAPPGLDGATRATLACLCYRPTTGTTVGFGGSAGGTAGNNRFSFIGWTDGNAYCAAEGNASGGAYGSMPLPAGWHWVVMAFDGTGPNNWDRLKVYIDGQLQPLSYYASIPASLGFVSPVTFGRDSLGRTTDGTYAAGMIWSGRALSAGDAASLASDPWALFARPPARRFFAPAASSGRFRRLGMDGGFPTYSGGF